ncbi:MAG: acyltransferase [Archangiaceae bacterium]|nr:acyltransferase [Archangiaceae bacterium]
MSAAPGSHRRDIDGLRGLAVLLVVLFHAWPRLLPGGYVGVDVFFVISGFVVTGLVQRQRAAGTFRVVDFFFRRVNRLAPALLVVVGATLGFAAWRFSPTLLALTASHAAASLGLSANLLIATQGGYFDAAAEVKPLLHLWSLSVEEQFYLLVPVGALVARAAPRWTRPLVIVAALGSFVLCVALTRASARWAYFLPMTRAWELLAGVLLSLFASPSPSTSGPKQLASVAGVVFIIGSALGLDASTPFPGAFALLPVVGTVLVIGAGSSSRVNRLLSTPLVVGAGLVSYPLYLWHWPLLTIGRLSLPPSSHAVATPVLVAAALVLAWLTARFVERPVRTKQSRRVAFALATSGAVTAVVLAAMVLTFTPEQWALRGPLAAKVTRFEHDYDFKTDARWGTCWLLDDEHGPDADECIERTPAERPLVVVWGDSYAARLTAGLRLIQAERPTFRIGQRTRASCPPLFGHGTTVCRDANAGVMEELRTLRPDVLVLHARWNGVPHDLPQTLLALKQMLPSTKVMVLGQPPEWNVGLPWALTKWVGDEVVPERLEPESLAEQRTFEQQTRALSTTGGAAFTSALDALCDANATCLVRLSLEPLVLSTWDYGHLTTPASKVVARRLVLQLELP